LRWRTFSDVTSPGIRFYIPDQVWRHGRVDPKTTPVDACMDKVVVEVGKDGVSAPATADRAGLAQVSPTPRREGIELKVVVLAENPGIDTPLRDVATQVGHEFQGRRCSSSVRRSPVTSSPVVRPRDARSRSDMAKIPGIRYWLRRISSTS